MESKTVKTALDYMDKENRAEQQARAQLESIKDMVLELECAETDQKNGHGSSDQRLDNATEAILEDALSVEVRGPWHSVGKEPDMISEEFQILLCTGGPAVRIMGELGAGFEPIRAWIEYQDWGTPWTEFRLTAEEEETVLRYCACFYFGE